MMEKIVWERLIEFRSKIIQRRSDELFPGFAGNIQKTRRRIENDSRIICVEAHR